MGVQASFSSFYDPTKDKTVLSLALDALTIFVNGHFKNQPPMQVFNQLVKHISTCNSFDIENLTELQSNLNQISTSRNKKFHLFSFVFLHFVFS